MSVFPGDFESSKSVKDYETLLSGNYFRNNFLCQRVSQLSFEPVPVLTEVLLGSLVSRGESPLTSPSSSNAGSGGFLEHVFRLAAQQLFQVAYVRTEGQRRRSD